jgi:hypothetical protein
MLVSHDVIDTSVHSTSFLQLQLSRHVSSIVSKIWDEHQYTLTGAIICGYPLKTKPCFDLLTSNHH